MERIGASSWINANIIFSNCTMLVAGCARQGPILTMCVMFKIVLIARLTHKYTAAGLAVPISG